SSPAPAPSSPLSTASGAVPRMLSSPASATASPPHTNSTKATTTSCSMRSRRPQTAPCCTSPTPAACTSPQDSGRRCSSTRTATSPTSPSNPDDVSSVRPGQYDGRMRRSIRPLDLIAWALYVVLAVIHVIALATHSPLAPPTKLLLMPLLAIPVLLSAPRLRPRMTVLL